MICRLCRKEKQDFNKALFVCDNCFKQGKYTKQEPNGNGELGDCVKFLKGKNIECWCQEEKHKIDELLSYQHTWGLLDQNGKGHWLFWICPKCFYQWSFHKILHRLDFQH